MALRNDLSAEYKADLVNYNAAFDGQAFILLSNTVLGDSSSRIYRYSATATNTIDGENVLAATGMGGVGRFIKVPVEFTGMPRGFNSPSFAQSTTARQLSTTRDGWVTYSYDSNVTITLLAGQTVEVILEYADNSGMSTNVTRVSSMKTGNSGVLGLSSTQTLTVSGTIPMGKYSRVRFVTTGTGTVTPTSLQSGQEVLL